MLGALKGGIQDGIQEGTSQGLCPWTAIAQLDYYLNSL